jgi:aspartokinase/homoserine dehydrogenase 1
MHFITGVAGRFFSALGDAKINVLAISQGSSERNISAVVFESESTRALRAVHAAFRLSHRMVRVGIIGMNEIGFSLLKLLETQRNKLKKSFAIDLQVCAVMNDGDSSDMVVLKNQKIGGSGIESITSSVYNTITRGSSILGVSADSVSFQDLESGIGQVESGGLAAFNQHVYSEDYAHSVIFDCTADERVGEKHVDWLKVGTNVVTANSSALAGDIQMRNEIKKTERENKASYLREVTVGGGLPVISTLRGLLNSGDQIHRLDGVLSVTMSYVMHRIAPSPGTLKCGNFDESITKGAYSRDLSISPLDHGSLSQPCSFSQAMREAAALGFTEEDPTKDINNEFTARCLMVLAHEVGLDERYDVEKIQSLSESLSLESSKPYCEMEAELDLAMQARVQEALAKGCVPRHVCSIDVKTSEIRIKIMDVPQSHIFATLPPSCECVRFFTRRHKTFPLVIQGPSAGADSTASALLADLLNSMTKKEGSKSGELSKTLSSSFIHD